MRLAESEGNGKGPDIRGNVSIGLEIFHPRSSATFSPCRPKPKPPNFAPGLIDSGTSGSSLSLSLLCLGLGLELGLVDELLERLS